MKNKIALHGHELLKIKLSETEYKIAVFKNGELICDFIVTLQHTEVDTELPTFQLKNKNQIIPTVIKEELKYISDWISGE
jgi:hypothetical protein